MKAYIALLVLLLGALAALIWKDVSKSQGAAPEAQATSTTPAARPQSKGVGIEQDWLVDEVVRDVAEMAAFAAEGPSFDVSALQISAEASPAAPLTYEISIQGSRGEVSQTLTLQHHLWSPASYAPLAKALLAAWKVKADAAAAPVGQDLPTTLQKPDTGVFIKENKRISEALNQQPANAAAHEAAALLIGTLAFREAAGEFSDLRPALGRLAAHLALAQALQAEPGICGQLATALQLTLVNRQTEALEHVAKLPADLQAWKMALRLRNTGDWRLLPSPKSATLLEQLAYGRSLLVAADANLLVDFLEAKPPLAAPADVPDWHRLALGVSFSVQEGHVFATNSIAREFMDFTAAWLGMTGERPQEKAVVSALNTPMTRAVIRKPGGVRLEALSTGALASFHQRHLAHAIARTQYFFQEMWGEDQAAAELEQMVRTTLSELTLYPLLLPRVNCNDSLDASLRTAAAQFCKQHPRLVTAEKWAVLERPEKGAATAGDYPPPSNQWFTTGLPFGTAMDVYGRACRLDCLLRLSQEQRKALNQLAPHDFHLLYNYALAFTPPKSEAFRQVLEPLADYNLVAARLIADVVCHDAKAYAAAMEKVCRIDANEYITLGRYFAHNGMTAEAERAYRQAFEKAPDRVQMANSCDWLINHYFDTNRRDEAVMVAKDAAEVYSFRGLESAGKLMERMENWKEAMSYYEAIEERYNSREPLVGYLLRQKEKSPEAARAYDALVGQEFPDGMKNVTLADFTEAPATGTVITSSSSRIMQHGLKVGDVIVALDGYRVDTFGQYGFVRGMKADAPLQLILWDGSKYREQAASVPDRRFECSMETYTR